MINIIVKTAVAMLITVLTVSTASVAHADSNERSFDEHEYFHGRSPRVNQHIADRDKQAFHYRKGVRYFNLGKFRVAELSFKQALRGASHNYRANVYLGLTNIQQNDFKSAVRYLKAALKSNPDQYCLKATLGLTYVELGKLEKAEIILADLRERTDTVTELSADEIDLKSSIAALEQALAKT